MAERKNTVKQAVTDRSDSDAGKAEVPVQVHQVGLSTNGNGKVVPDIDENDERVKQLVARDIPVEDAIRLVRSVTFF